MTHEQIGLSMPDRTQTEGLNLDAAMEQHDLARRTTEMSQIQWLPFVGGALLAGYGLSRGGGGGVVLALAGGGLVYYGLTGRAPLVGGDQTAPEGERSVRVKKSITVNLPPEQVYDAWRDIERLPHIMSHLESVRNTGDGRSHWVAKAPMGRTVEWDAEVFNDDENRVIAWRSVGETSVPNVGAVHFDEAPGGRGTEIAVTIEYLPPAGRAGATVAKLFGEEPGQQVTDDLRRFKQYIETGEIPTTEGQPRGARRESLMDAGMDKLRQVAEAGHAVVDGVDTAPRS